MSQRRKDQFQALGDVGNILAALTLLSGAAVAIFQIQHANNAAAEQRSLDMSLSSGRAFENELLVRYDRGWPDVLALLRKVSSELPPEDASATRSTIRDEYAMRLIDSEADGLANFIEVVDNYDRIYVCQSIGLCDSLVIARLVDPQARRFFEKFVGVSCKLVESWRTLDRWQTTREYFYSDDICAKLSANDKLVNQEGAAN